MDVQEDGCRVLAISPSLEGAMLFIEHMQRLSIKGSSKENLTSSSHPSVPVTVPYTISNRYYSADIHFAAYELHTVHPGLFSPDRAPDYKPPPAVVFVWIDGEPYAKHVEELSKTMALSAYEPEVSLAVRISKLATETVSPDISHTADASSEDENTDIDSTLISFGFEYVDATRVSSRVPSESDSPDDVPSLPRVLDALSTIMWPSMQPFSKAGKGKVGSGDSSKRQWERDSIMEELLSVSGISGISGSDSRNVNGRGEGDENDDTDDELGGAPFSPYDFSATKSVGSKPTFDRSPGIGITSSGTRTWSAFSSPAIGFSTDTQGEISLSPTDIDATTPFGTRGPSFADGGPDNNTSDSNSNLFDEATKKKVSIGFEDDFTVFVSAPPLASNAAAVPGRPSAWYPLDISEAGFAAQNTADVETPLGTAVATAEPLALTPDQLDKSHLAPSSAHNRMSYRSLGSVSDFGGSEVDPEEKGMRQGYTTLEDDDEEDAGEDEWEDRDPEGNWGDVADVDEEDLGDEKDMPTMDEVMAMADRIFSKMPLPGDADGEYSVGFKSAASAFSSQSVFAAASSTVIASQKGSIVETESVEIKSAASSSLSSSTSGATPKPREAESQPAADKSASTNTGPNPALLERMRRLGGMTATSDFQFGIAALRERSPGNGNSGTDASQPQTRTSSSDIDVIDAEGEDSDIPPFDLTRVLHSLQTVRGEIAGLDDEDERRRMAAKVALGLVYGMDMDVGTRGVRG